MMKKLASAIILPALFLAGTASATIVSEIKSSYTGDYIWFKNDVRANGTASIENLSGKGGNLENNAPYPTGAAKLTTGLSNTDKAEIGIGGNFGTIGNFVASQGQLGYDYYKSASDANPFAAASMKLAVADPNSGGVKFLIYEAYGNMPGNPPVDTWTNVTINSGSGTFWHNGILGEDSQGANVAAGKTLDGWASELGDAFLELQIIGLSVGVGSYNQGMTAYFDGVFFYGNDHELLYDFEVSVVPLPAALPLYGAGVAILGFLGWRRKKAV